MLSKASVLLPLLLNAAAFAQPPDLPMYAKIRNEGTTKSRVMDYAVELIDGIGPRLTGSPNLTKAIEWARKTLTTIGCTNVRTESWGEFGMSWQERNGTLRMTQPELSPLIARAAPWSPPTRNGPITAELIAVHGFKNEKDFEAYRGKLRGKIVLLGMAPSMPKVFPIDQPLFERFNEKQLEEFAAQPDEPSTTNFTLAAHFSLMEKTGQFLAAEQAAAVIVPSGNNTAGGASGGTISVDTNYTFGWHVYKKAKAMRVPLVVVSIEHYGRLSRLLERGSPVKVELNVDTQLGDATQEGLNVFADLPGADPQHKDELVIVAAHLDSWAAGTGATDDGAGVIIAMETMRILKAVGVTPRRTIRLALWTGEEQGALGSREFVRRHLADIPPSADSPALPEFLRRLSGPVKPKPDHARISAVYTLDAGSGKVRGISTGNPKTTAIFQEWFAPLRDLGVTMVAARGDCGGDCAIFDQIGIPAPSFRQDPLDYESRTHHTNMDTYEHLIPEDLKQAAVVVATTIYNTAMRDEMLPRK